MIVFDLECRAGGHRFEGWFGSSDDFADQQARGLLCCPQCGNADVGKAVMAPSVGRKGNQKAEPLRRPAAPSVPAPTIPGQVSNAPMPPEAVQMMRKLARMQAEALKQSRWVGDKFAESAKAMHYGEREAEAIYGEATPEQASALIEEGIAVAPLPFPVVPPDKAN
jgi:hypothetical protein